MASLTSQNSIIIENLLEATTDKNENVRAAIYSSLKKIALCHPSEVITAAIGYRRGNPKLSNSELRNIFEVIKNVCEERLSKMENPLVEEIINCAIEESVKASKAPFISADLLPVIGTKYCEQVFNQLQKYMPETVAPHASVIYTLGHLSVANMVAFHPFSINVFKYLLSILHVTKTDSMRKLYANTVCQLVESIIEQISVEELSTKKEQYSPLVEDIFDTLVTTWLQIKDPGVCEVIIQAVSSLVLLFSDQKLTSDTSRILNSFLTLYKKPISFPRYIITQGLSNFLSVVSRAALQPSLDLLLSTLHVMVAIFPDFTQPVTVKNHSEILRCYDYLGGLFEDKLTEVILTSLRSTTEHDKVVGLTVATHLLNSSESVMKPKMGELLSALHRLLNDTNVKVNKSMAKIINVLAYKGYLTEKEAAFIEFLARHTYHNSVTNADQDDLEAMCKNTLNFLNTTLPSVQSLCWKVLIQLLMNGEHLQSVAVFAKSLAYLISKCELSVLEKNCYDRSEVIFVRVISLLGSPLHDNRGVYLLNFLNDYIQWKVKVDPLIWKSRMTELIAYLEDSVWNEVEWENQLLSALSASFTDDAKPWLEAVNTETSRLLQENQNSIDQNQNNYSNNITIDERSMLYKLLALLSQYMDDAGVVNSNITKILSPINQRSLVDLKACSRSIGILSRIHFNHVFNELDKFQRTELTRKPTKFLGFIKDTKGENEIEIIRRMICECFSSMLVEAPSRLLLPKFKQLLHWFINLIQNTKDSQTANSCMEALFHASEVLLKNEDTYEQVDDRRKELLSFISNTVHQEKAMPSVICLKTTTVLFKLSSSTSATEKLHLLQKCLNKMFQYYSVSSSTATIAEGGAIKADPIIQQLCLLIEHSVDTKNSTVLEEIVLFLRQWLSHKIINHRIISLYLLKSALNSYVVCYFNDTKNYVKFTLVGSLLGRLYVRTFETNEEMSRLACECIILLFAIAEANADNVGSSVADIQKSMRDVDRLNIEFFRVSVYCKLSPEQLQVFNTELMSGLLDSENSCACGTGKLLTVLFTEVGSQFHRQALDIFNDLLFKLVKLKNEETSIVAIEVILSFARHHKEMFVNTMLNQSIPFHPNVCRCWSVLAQDDSFTDDMLKRLFETIKWNPSQEEDAQKKQKNVTVRPLVAIAAVKEILSRSADTADFASSHFVDLFPAVLMLIPIYMGEGVRSMNGVNQINKDVIATFTPAKLIFETLLTLMQHVHCKDVDKDLAVFAEKIDFRKQERKPVYFEMIRHLARDISRFDNEVVTKILDALWYYASNDRTEGQRATVVIFFVEIFNLKCCEDAVLVDTVMLNLINFLNDESAFVRENSLKGLANISNLESALVERYKERLLSALTTGLDDYEANTQLGIIIQSLTGLSKLLPFLSSGQYASIFINISIRIKPFFEKENTEVRQLSIRLFGELASVSSTEMASFKDQAFRNLPCILFHLGEKEPDVVEACKFSLKAMSSSLKSEPLAAQIAKYVDDDCKMSYQEYFVEIIELLAKELPEMSSDYITIAISYTKSSWHEIRANAVLFIGTMYASQTETSDKLPVDALTSRILALLKDIDVNVRANAATSLGLLLHSASSEYISNK